MNWRRVAVAAGVVVALAVVLLAVFGLPTHLLFSPTASGASAGLSPDDVEYDVVAENLDVPWEVVVLGEGQYLVTERTASTTAVGLRSDRTGICR